MRELATGQQLKVISEGLDLASRLSIKLLREGKWQPTNPTLMNTYLDSLQNAVGCLTKLITEQNLFIETERIIKQAKEKGE